jgi:HlyD family secretion protein
MKKVVIVFIVLAIVATGALLFTRYQARGQNAATLRDLEMQPVRRGDLKITVGATGDVRSNQSATLTWQTSGTVAEVDVELGEQVSTSQVLASLEKTSLPQQNILAQADLIDAQRALDDLLHSQTQQAQAHKTVEDAQQALQDALNPELSQANLGKNIAAAQKTVDDAQRNLDILTTPVSQAAIDQAYANMLLAENALNNTKNQIARIEKKLKKPEEAYIFFESRQFYNDILENLESKLVRDQRSYEDSVEKHNDLLEPPNPNDVALAEAALALAQARLAQAERDWEREKDGPSQAEIAFLQAQLADAQREMERLQGGPDPDDIAEAEARVAAAQAALDQVSIIALFDGTITEVISQPGDQVTSGTPAFRLDDLSTLIVDVQVSEVDINHIWQNQPVVFTFDSILAKEYLGKVLEVPPVGEVQAGVTNFTVQVEITDADEQIKPGMTSAITFVVDEIDDVLLVPNRATRIHEGQRVVYILQDGQLTPVKVVLGSSSDTDSQVLESHLQPGDEIVLNPPNDLP